MRRPVVRFALWTILAVALAGLPAPAQQVPINPRIPPPPPPPEEPAREKPAPPSQLNLPVEAAARAEPVPLAPEPMPPLPARVTVPAGTHFAVVLGTPLSTRMTKPGQAVTFHTADPLRVHDALELPVDTEFTGSVVEVGRPGGFGKAGTLRVKLERIQLSTGASAAVAAHLDAPDADKQGRIRADKNNSANLMNLGMWTVQGTLLGARIKGGKGAAVGAGAGALTGLIIMMAQRGPDLYLEPGMPFQVVLDQPVELPGQEVYAAQQAAKSSRTRAEASDAEANGTRSEIERDPDNATLDPSRPKLKRRPR